MEALTTEYMLENITTTAIPDMKPVMVVFTFFYLLLALAICISNFFTILVVWRTPSLRTIPNMYIVALAVADFFTGLSIPYYTVTNFPSAAYHLESRPYLCMTRYILLYTFLSNSFLCIFCIAVDRFVFVVYPLRYHHIFSVRKTCLIITLTWIVSLSGGLSTLWEMTWKGECEVYSVLNHQYQLYGLIPYMGLILVFTAVLYLCITRVALKQRNAVSSLIVLEKVKQDFLRRSTIKSMRLFLVVYGMFVVCWAPVYVLTIIGLVGGSTRLGFQVSLTLGLMNSGINFIIYACMSKDFRKAFKDLVRGKCSQSK